MKVKGGIMKIRNALLLLSLSMMMINTCYSAEIDLDIIIQIESNWKHNAKSHKGAVGLCQITKPCLRDFNDFNYTFYTMKDMIDPQKNMRVSQWYLNERIPQMLKARGYVVTVENVLVAYNAGISNLKRWRLFNETREYIDKYNTLVNK